MYNLKVHQRNKHNAVKEEVEDHPLPMQSEEQLTNWELMEDSIVVLKIYKLLALLFGGGGRAGLNQLKNI